MAAAHAREACGIPGTSVRTAYLCRDKPSMKEALREVGIATAQSTGASSCSRGARVRRRRSGTRSSSSRARGRGRLGHEPRRLRCRARPGACRARRVGRGRTWRWRSSSRVTRASTTRSASTADPRTTSSRTTTRTCSRRCASAGSARSSSRRTRSTPTADYEQVRDSGPARDRRTRHRHVGDAHGVVLRPEGPAFQRDRVPSSRCSGLGSLRRRQRCRHLPRVGEHDRPSRGRPAAVAPPVRGDRCAPPGSRRDDHALRRARGGAAPVRAVDPRHAPARATRRRSRSRPATWQTPGSAWRIPTSTRCITCSTSSVRRSTCAPREAGDAARSPQRRGRPCRRRSRRSASTVRWR